LCGAVDDKVAEILRSDVGVETQVSILVCEKERGLVDFPAEDNGFRQVELESGVWLQ
jgi:hypothetical protein